MGISDGIRKLKLNEPKMKATTATERIEMLRALRDALLAQRSALREALARDFRKPASEADITEVFTSVSEITHMMKHLRGWMKRRRVPAPMALMGYRSSIVYEPKGTVLVIGPWNYPVQLTVIPLATAISAGNCVALKPSELTPHTTAFLKKLLSSIFTEDQLQIFEGGPEVSQQLLAERWDHVFFTGSTRVGRIVMQAAAKHLTPVTLELGGKSPAIIDETADLKATAERIAWGKITNAGQTCVAPDYACVPRALEGRFVEELQNAVTRVLGASEDERRRSPDLARIITSGHYQRLKKLVDGTVAKGAKIAVGGTFVDEERYISPTVLTGVGWDTPIMEDEIFGPILPVLAYDSIDQVYDRVAQGEKPLSLYLFSSDDARIDEGLRRTTAGGTVVNSCMVHLSNANLPFGGVGSSGIGNYHGEFGFKAFSHERAVMRQGPIDWLKLFYPPYTNGVKRMIELAIRYLR